MVDIKNAQHIEQPRTLVGNSVGEFVEYARSSDSERRCIAAAHPDLPVFLVRELAKDLDPGVRYALARRGDLPPDIAGPLRELKETMDQLWITWHDQ